MKKILTLISLLLTAVSFSQFTPPLYDGKIVMSPTVFQGQAVTIQELTVNSTLNIQGSLIVQTNVTGNGIISFNNITNNFLIINKDLNLGSLSIQGNSGNFNTVCIYGNLNLNNSVNTNFNGVFYVMGFVNGTPPNNVNYTIQPLTGQCSCNSIKSRTTVITTPHITIKTK